MIEAASTRRCHCTRAQAARPKLSATAAVINHHVPVPVEGCIAAVEEHLTLANSHQLLPSK